MSIYEFIHKELLSIILIYLHELSFYTDIQFIDALLSRKVIFYIDFTITPAIHSILDEVRKMSRTTFRIHLLIHADASLTSHAYPIRWD